MPPENVPMLGWIEILLIMLLSGAFGGILDVLRIIDVRKLIEQSEQIVASKWHLFYALTLGGVIGGGGGVAMLLFLTSTAKLHAHQTPENILFLLSLGLISGFLGYTLLKGMADRVKEQVGNQIVEKVEESAKKIEVATDAKIETTERRIIKHTHEAASAITKGFAAADDLDRLHSGKVDSEDEKQRIFSDAKVALSAIEEVRKQAPDNRTIGIVNARLHRGLGQLDEAIKVLNEVLQKKMELGTTNDRDAAALLYNKACYYCLLAGKLDADNPKREELKEKAYKNLEKALSIPESFSEYQAYALDDDDWVLLREEERFKRLLKISNNH